MAKLISSVTEAYQSNTATMRSLSAVSVVVMLYAASCPTAAARG
jgi:hypothetical protein